jgi:serine/threonine protein kinase
MTTPTIPGYRIVRTLSEGNRAHVYLAEQQSLQRLVALKVLSFAMSDNEASRKRVIEEGKAAARLTHPNLLSVFDIGEADGRHFIATEYVSGGTMRDRLSNGALEIDKVLSIARDLTTGMKFLHSQGFLHRDIKPTNVFFREDGTALLGEAGVARAVSGKTPENEQVAFGSPHYMSPERAQALPSDGRSDQYSLAVVIWEALTGKPPFDADDPFQVAIKHISEPVPALPLALAPMQPILGRCLAKQAEQRFASAGELLAAIDQLIAARAGAQNTNAPVMTEVVKPVLAPRPIVPTVAGATTQPVDVVPERKPIPAKSAPEVGETSVMPVLAPRNFAIEAPGGATAIVAPVPAPPARTEIVRPDVVRSLAPAIPPATVLGQRVIAPDALQPKPPAVPQPGATMVSAPMPQAPMPQAPAPFMPPAPSPFLPPAQSQGEFAAPTPFMAPTGAQPAQTPAPRVDSKRSNAAGWLIWIGVLGLLCAGAAAWWVLKGSKEQSQKQAPTPGAGQLGDVATPPSRSSASPTAPPAALSAPLSTTTPTPPSADVDALTVLSEKARTAFAAGDFVSPQGECAAAYYQQILQQNPDDADAQLGLSATGDGAEQQIQKLLADGTQSTARAYLDAAMVYFSDRESLKKLKAQFDAQG